MSTLTKRVEFTERELGQLMVLFTGGELEERSGFNLSPQEQDRLGDKCRRAVWELYWQRRQQGLPTQLDRTGVLEPVP